MTRPSFAIARCFGLIQAMRGLVPGLRLSGHLRSLSKSGYGIATMRRTFPAPKRRGGYDSQAEERAVCRALPVRRHAAQGRDGSVG